MRISPLVSSVLGHGLFSQGVHCTSETPEAHLWEPPSTPLIEEGQVQNPPGPITLFIIAHSPGLFCLKWNRDLLFGFQA